MAPIHKGLLLRLLHRHKPGSLITRDGKFWVPLIALFTGMRMGEIVQLQISDIKNENNIFYFDVSKGADKSLKKSGSKRRIPVHAMPIDFGFLNYVQSSKSSGRIFTESRKVPTGTIRRTSASTGLAILELQVSKKTAFHSFRHNFLDALRAADQSNHHA